MPPRSKVYDLPQELRDELNERLVTSGFQGYEALTEWLAENGYKLSRSAVHRYGSALQEEFDEAMSAVRKSTEMAKAWAESDEDSKGALMGATSQMVQNQLMQITLALCHQQVTIRQECRAPDNIEPFNHRCELIAARHICLIAR